MILIAHAQQLKGLRTCGDKEGSALDKFMLQSEGCLVFGLRRLELSDSGRFILSEFYQYLLINIQMVWKASITQPDLP